MDSSSAACRSSPSLPLRPPRLPPTPQLGRSRPRLPPFPWRGPGRVPLPRRGRTDPLPIRLPGGDRSTLPCRRGALPPTWRRARSRTTLLFLWHAWWSIRCGTKQATQPLRRRVPPPRHWGFGPRARPAVRSGYGLRAPAFRRHPPPLRFRSRGAPQIRCLGRTPAPLFHSLRHRLFRGHRLVMASCTAACRGPSASLGGRSWP